MLPKKSDYLQKNHLKSWRLNCTSEQLKILQDCAYACYWLQNYFWKQRKAENDRYTRYVKLHGSKRDGWDKQSLYYFKEWLKQLSALKREHPFLQNTTYAALQHTLFVLDHEWGNYCIQRARGNKVSRPELFKYDSGEFFYYEPCVYRKVKGKIYPSVVVGDGFIKLPKVGKILCPELTPVTEQFSGAQIWCKQDKYGRRFISIALVKSGGEKIEKPDVPAADDPEILDF